MKFMMIFLLSASFMNLINGEDNQGCVNMCVDAELGTRDSFSQSLGCRQAQNVLDCFRNKCRMDVASRIPETEEMLRRQGISCDLSGSSALSGSLLIVLVALLMTAYRALV